MDYYQSKKNQEVQVIRIMSKPETDVKFRIILAVKE